MAFNIYDPKGFRRPYHPEDQWRSVKPSDEPLPYLESQKHKIDPKSKDEIKKAPENGHYAPKTFKEEHVIIASQIMKQPVVTMSPTTSIKEAWDLITTRRFRHVPVVNDEGHLIGILSDRTLFKELYSADQQSTSSSRDQTVADLMVTHVLTALPNTDIAAIAKILIENRIGAMPIVDQTDKIVGILTRSDILRTIVKIDLTELRV